ncbi:RNA-binding protein Rsf1 isoform X2 [Venturia canescens]|uniref:RNA-binding protein Rsf1 isoform X2 n=1 Tax=Venturia canescens TaxID=32260 RepID=UPI001C9C7366|nr:RNA-binding protein Rsf1 isoform X2 [Venturia canescens]
MPKVDINLIYTRKIIIPFISQRKVSELKEKMTPEGYTRVYVGGLNDKIKKDDLQMEFEKFGKLNKVWMAFNPPGFAFIEFLSMDEAELACNNMNGTEIMGAKLRVEISRGRGRGGGRGSSGSFRGSRGSGSRGFSSRGSSSGGSSGGYRGSNSYNDHGSSSGGYSTGRGGSRGRGRYDDSYSSSRSSGYVSRDSYSQDSYGTSGDTGDDYYSGKDSSTARYRSRSPAGRGSHRHLRECT